MGTEVAAPKDSLRGSSASASLEAMFAWALASSARILAAWALGCRIRMTRRRGGEGANFVSGAAARKDGKEGCACLLGSLSVSASSEAILAWALASSARILAAWALGVRLRTIRRPGADIVSGAAARWDMSLR